MRNEAYTGIGAREIPADILSIFTAIGRQFSERGITLRSGGSPGADTAFEVGCGAGPKEIYLPWAGFNGHTSPLVMSDEFFGRITGHEAWRVIRDALRRETPPTDLDVLPHSIQLLYARDVPEVLGTTLDAPSTRVICWTPPNGEAEGTRIALYVAQHWSVPVENLNDLAILQGWRNATAAMH